MCVIYFFIFFALKDIIGTIGIRPVGEKCFVIKDIIGITWSVD